MLYLAIKICPPNSSVVVDDGTSVAMVTVTGDSVRSLLKLSHDQWTCLEQEVVKSGEVFIQQVRVVYLGPLSVLAVYLCKFQ